MSGSSRRRFADVVRGDDVDLGLACALIGVEVEPDLDVGEPLRALDALAESAADAVAAHGGAEGLHEALGRRAGFHGRGGDYLDVRASLLHEVLRRGRGLPILLSVVWLEVAGRLGVPAVGLGLPGHFMVQVGEQVVDPYAGGVLLSRAQVAARVGETAGVELVDEHLEPWTAPDILLRVLTNIRGLASRSQDLRMQLWATELSLLLPRHPLALRREHGELLVRLGSFARGAHELEAYADAIAGVEPAVADKTLQAARLARARLN